MQYIKSKISNYYIKQSTSLSLIDLSRKRRLPSIANSQGADIEVYAKEILALKHLIKKAYLNNFQQRMSITEHLLEQDRFLTAKAKTFVTK